MKRVKRVIPLIIAFIIGISTTVGAATVFNSKDITYSSSATSKTNVKDSLDELYTKANTPWKCADGWYCYTSPKTISSAEIGNYVSMTPTSTNYTISKSLTGYTSDQKINPSELNLWRVIRKNEDGTVEVVSHYVSSKEVYFKGTIGYMNFIGALNTIASQYTNTKYVSKTRYTGYSNQIENCSSYETENCPGDTGYEEDINAISKSLNGTHALKPNSSAATYWVASRSTGDGLQLRAKGTGGNWLAESVYWGSAGNNNEFSHSIRPILTLKADVQIKSGDGKSASTAYQLS